MVYGSFNDEANSVWDFTRCQKPNGKIYGSPNRCRPPAVEIGAKEKKETKEGSKEKGLRIGKTVKDMSVDQMEKLLKDPRIKRRQIAKLRQLIADKKAEGPKPTSAAAKQARPVDPKVAAKVDKAVKAKAAGPQYTPEQLAAQNALLAKQKKEQAEAEKPKKVGRTVQEELDRQVLRGEVKLDRNVLAMRGDLQGSSVEMVARMKSEYRTMQQLMKDPAFQTPGNRSRMINMRLAIWEKERALRAKANRPARPEDEAAIKASPKYDKTPGSTKPIANPKTVDVPKLEKDLERLKKAFDKESDPEKKLKISNELLDVNSRIRAANEESLPLAPRLREIYEQQGFNAKPELVRTVSDLQSRKDLMMGSDGRPVIMYRGVTSEDFARQFKGLGEEGDIHYPGRGIFGNGTYAAAPDNAAPQTSAAAPIKTAKAYASDRKGLSEKITAFGLRADANVVRFPGTDTKERMAAFDSWYDKTIAEAERKTGYKYKDIGEAAAALGIHAYEAPQRGEDFFVVLNRGAVVAAMDSGIDDEE